MKLNTSENIGLWKAAMFAEEAMRNTSCFLGDKHSLNIFDNPLSEVDPLTVKDILQNTRNLSPFLSLILNRLIVQSKGRIAEKTDKFDEVVVDGYLIGNRAVLEYPTSDEKSALVKKWEESYPVEMLNETRKIKLERKAEHLTSLHHSSTVIASALSEKWSKDKIAQALNICGIRYGVIKSIEKSVAKVEASIFYQIDKKVFVKNSDLTFEINPWVGVLNSNDFVLIHKTQVIQRTDQSGFIEITNTTNLVLDRYNDYVSSLSRKS